MLSPRKKEFIKLDDNHTVALYLYGNEEGVPLLFLHGGPGAGFNHKRLKIIESLLDKINFVTFDQRGAGLSSTKDVYANNTTHDLISDIEIIREYLGIKRWVVSGTSWGSALSLLYATKYPQYCAKVLIASTFLARRQDKEWTFQGARYFFEDIFLMIEDVLQIKLKGNLEDIIFRDINSADVYRQNRAVLALSILENSMGRLKPFEISLEQDEDFNENHIRSLQIQMHYSKNNFFIDPNFGVLKDVTNLAQVPISVLHGRYDMCSHISQSFTLKRHLPHINLNILPGGHSISEDCMSEGFYQLISEAIE